MLSAYQYSPSLPSPNCRVTEAVVRIQRNLSQIYKKTLHFSLQINSTEFIHCKMLVDQELMRLQPSNAVYIFCPAGQALQGHPKARPPQHDPAGLKNSFQMRWSVTVNQPVLAPCTPTTAQIAQGTVERAGYNLDSDTCPVRRVAGGPEEAAPRVPPCSCWKETRGESLLWTQQLQN